MYPKQQQQQIKRTRIPYMYVSTFHSLVCSLCVIITVFQPAYGSFHVGKICYDGKLWKIGSGEYILSVSEQFGFIFSEKIVLVSGGGNGDGTHSNRKRVCAKFPKQSLRLQIFLFFLIFTEKPIQKMLHTCFGFFSIFLFLYNIAFYIWYDTNVLCLFFCVCIWLFMLFRCRKNKSLFVDFHPHTMCAEYSQKKPLLKTTFVQIDDLYSVELNIGFYSSKISVKKVTTIFNIYFNC